EPAVDPLIEALSDEDHQVREGAAKALGDIGEPAVDSLIEALSDEDHQVREGAAKALGDIGDFRAVDLLIEALDDENIWVVVASIEALVHIGESAIDSLIEALGNENVRIKNRAVSILGDIGEPAVGPLVEALSDESPIVKKMAAKALMEIGPLGMMSILGLSGDDASYEDVIAVLIDALGNENNRMESAILILGQLGEPAVEPLIEALKDFRVRKRAEDVLTMIGNASFIPTVNSLLKSEDADLQDIGAGIIQGLAEQLEGESGIDPTIDIVHMGYMDKKSLREIVLTDAYSISCALALYYLGEVFNDVGFLEDHMFDEIDGELYVKDREFSKLEIAAILNTNIPSELEWWGKLANKDERLKYVELVLKGDFVDERNYIAKDRAWLCVQYAVQAVINFNGYDKEFFADQEVFEEYGAGYVITPISYGIPLYFAVSPGHAFNAAFIGDGEISDNLRDWILIEPMDDDFSPNYFGSDYIEIYRDDIFFMPDMGFLIDSITGTTIQVDVTDYFYGADRTKEGSS
ncbi:MAG: HEAT repeat domain-containing protein, partial [Candidatus Kaelpia aquatica]|nr:HEAT repeat domain-containing protein [Candidatus Kaelpia aquatica]